MRSGLLVMFLLCGLSFAVAQESSAEFDLASFRQLAASDRSRGIEVGREAIRNGVFADQPRQRLFLLWHMGGAAIGKADGDVLDEVIAGMRSPPASQADGAESLAGFLRATWLIDEGQAGEGLIMALEAANALPADDPVLRAIAATELCRDYSNAGKPERGLPHCRLHTRLLEESAEPVGLARAYYIEASVLSSAGRPEEAIPLWRASRDGFAAAGLDALAGRAAGGLAMGLNNVGEYSPALTASRQALEAAEQSGNALSVCIARGQVATALTGLAELDAALEEVDRALACVEGTGHSPTLHLIRSVQRDALAASGAGKEQLAALDREIAALSVGDEAPEQADRIESLEQRYLQREQELRIRELEQENRRKELDIQAARQQAQRLEQTAREQRVYTMLWGAGALLLAVLLVAGLVVYRAQRRVATSLREQAYRDSLTRLPNRRALLERVQSLLANHDDRSHALMIVDVDHFKQINDLHGHHAGDRMLIAIAGILSRHEPAGGIVGRLGGEEFVLLAPDQPAEAARALAERLRVAIAAALVDVGEGQAVSVTASIGVAVSADCDPATPAAWLSAADQALYRAKAQGRDRVAMAREA
ncbi:MAG: diguanylate cyclase [Lysobacteraceae bacterium]